MRMLDNLKSSIDLFDLMFKSYHSILLYNLVLGKLTHLKSLVLYDCALMYEHDFLMNIHKIIPSLETLVINNTNLEIPVPMEINYLIEVLDSIGNIKNLTIENSDFQYVLNNKEFGRPILKDLNEDQTKAIFERAMDVIIKKFPINSTSFEILDSAYGWSIKKARGKAPTMTKLPYKCTVIDTEEYSSGETCINFFAEKAELEEHTKWRFGHCFPSVTF